MSYNPKIHHRRSIRLKGYDYSQAGLYFITICTHQRKCVFGKIENDEMVLNDFGIVANDQWIKLADRYPNFELDVFQIMPNHMHGIINVGAGFTPAPIANPKDTTGQPQGIAPTTPNENSQNTIGQPQGIAPTTTDENSMNTTGQPQGIAPTVCDIIGAYKSLVANECLEIFKNKYPNIFMGKLWQRNYYEHIIRNEKSYKRISQYIINNPGNWNGDKFFEEGMLV